MIERDTDDKDPRGERGSFGLMGGGVSGESESSGPDRPSFMGSSSSGDSKSGTEGPWSVRFRAFLDSCSKLLVERIGEKNISCIFLCGSFAGDEGSIVFEEDRPLFLSDIDLAVVLESRDAHSELYKKRNGLAEACEGLLPEAEFLGHVDVAVLLPHDLERFPPRPGVFDTRKLGRVLYGDQDVIDRIPAYREGAIGGREAVLLIENRIIPFLGSYPTSIARTNEDLYRFLYQIARAYTDMATSALCLAGLYRPGYIARNESLKENRHNDLLSWFIPTELLPKIEMWTLFKVEPSIEVLDFEIDDRSSLNLWEQTASDLLEFWTKAECYIQYPHTDRSRLPAVGALLNSRPRRGRPYENLLAWKAYLSPLSLRRRSALISSMRGRILWSNPLEIVREFGPRLLDYHIRFGVECDVAEPAGGFPYRGTGWRDAAFSLYRLWTELVFGRKDP